MPSQTTPIKTISDALGLLVGLALSFAIGKWVFDDEVGFVGEGYVTIVRWLVMVIALAAPTFQFASLAYENWPTRWMLVCAGGIGGALSLFVLYVGFNVGASVQSKKYADDAQAHAQRQHESMQQYLRIKSEIERLAESCGQVRLSCSRATEERVPPVRPLRRAKCVHR